MIQRRAGVSLPLSVFSPPPFMTSVMKLYLNNRGTDHDKKDWREIKKPALSLKIYCVPNACLRAKNSSTLTAITSRSWCLPATTWSALCSYVSLHQNLIPFLHSSGVPFVSAARIEYANFCPNSNLCSTALVRNLSLLPRLSITSCGGWRGGYWNLRQKWI